MRSTSSPAPSRRVALVLFAVTLALAGCGRKGGLDLPPNGTPTQPGLLSSNQSEGQARTEVDSEAARNSLFNSSSSADQSPVATKGRKKSFVLDPLLGN